MENEVDFTKLKYVLYARKPTDYPERQATSIPDQIAEYQKLVRSKEPHTVTVLEESNSAETDYF